MATAKENDWESTQGYDMLILILYLLALNDSMRSSFTLGLRARSPGLDLCWSCSNRGGCEGNCFFGLHRICIVVVGSFIVEGHFSVK